MQKCSKCGSLKEISEFYVRNLVCKECYKKRVSEYQKTDHGRESHKQASKRYSITKNGKDINNKAQKKWQDKNHKKLLAKWAVNRAIKVGVLTRMPCEICGNHLSHGHHPDYNRQLDVIWLCAFHHKEWHTKNGEGLNPF